MPLLERRFSFRTGRHHGGLCLTFSVPDTQAIGTQIQAPSLFRQQREMHGIRSFHSRLKWVATKRAGGWENACKWIPTRTTYCILGRAGMGCGKVLITESRGVKLKVSQLCRIMKWITRRLVSNVCIYGDNMWESCSTLAGVTWVTFDSTSSSAGTPTPIIYVGVAASASLPTIYSTTDAGLTWCPLENQPLGCFPHHGVLSSDGTLYITYSTDVGPSGGTDGGVWKFHPNTAAWTNITPPKAINEAANGFGGMSVDAANPQTLIVASLNLWWPDGMLWRTRDGGATWNPIWTSGTYPSRTLKYRLDVTDVPWLNFGVKEDPTSPAPAVRLGWWMEGLAIDPVNSYHFVY